MNSRKKAQKAQKGFYTAFRWRRSRSFPLVRGVQFGEEYSFHCLRDQ
jgi:hypothetical protein